MTSSLFAKVSQEHVQEVLDNLHKFTGLQISLINDQGELVLSFGSNPRYCKLLKKNIFPKEHCFAVQLKAGQYAQKIGEPYIFSCHANLNHIAFPLINQKSLLGCIIVGPFLMDKPDSTLISDLAERHHLSPVLSLELYDELPGLQVISPTRVNQLSKLIDHLLSPLLPAEQAVLKQSQKKLYQQSRINEAIQMYKGLERPVLQNFFYEKENELLQKVRSGNIQESKRLLNELIGYVLFTEGSEIEVVRLHAIELTTLLSHVAIEGGAPTNSIYELNRKFVSLMTQEQNLDDLCYLLQDVAESFMDAMFYRRDQGNPHIREALQYIANNYPRKLTLGMVAQEVGLSSSHLSALFSQVLGMSFQDYLCSIRIEESKRLLLNTNYSLSEIAHAMGFPDQSYFSKVFKKSVGVSPGKYRN